MTDKLALGFILFYPSKISVNRIVETSNYGYHIFVLLNSILDDTLFSTLNSNESISIINNNCNNGLSEGIRLICNAAFINGNKALLYFDQDTIFTKDTLDYISKYFNYIRNTNDEFIKSMVSTTFRDSSITHKRNNYIASYLVADFIVQNVYFTINSGTLYFLEKIKSFDWFDNRYFVDGVDYSFCINCIKNKFLIFEIYNSPGLDHCSEQKDYSIRFMGKQLCGRVYPLNRNIDFMKSHLKIFFDSFNIKSFKPKLFILKSIFNYIIIQIVFRIKAR